MLRLRMPDKRQKLLFNELNKAAIIREVHTFGLSLPIDFKDDSKTQHQGLGKTLLMKAEGIARKNGFKRIAVIASVGTREYYRKFGYKLEGLYMTKVLV